MTNGVSLWVFIGESLIGLTATLIIVFLFLAGSRRANGMFVALALLILTISSWHVWWIVNDLRELAGLARGIRPGESMLVRTIFMLVPWAVLWTMRAK